MKNNKLKFENSALVVAHPDDEILWFSSIIENVDKIIIVFKGTNNKKVFSGREKIFNSKLLPYANKIICLEIEESDVFNSTNWKMPKLSNYGLKTNSIKYQKNFDKIKIKLNKNLEGVKNVITHNPWGEYGHEEHVQIFRVIISLLSELDYSIWISGYFSERSYALMSLFKSFIGENYVNHNINQKFCENVKSIYLKDEAWTWSNNYNWPQSETFYEVIKNVNNLKINVSRTPHVWNQMNFILMFDIHLSYLSKLRSKLIKFLQLLVPKIIFNILISNYRKIKVKYNQNISKLK